MDGSTGALPDFPYYDGQPISMGWLDWTIVLLSLVVAFACLTTISFAPWTGPLIDDILRAILFTCIPLAALTWRTGPPFKALFHGFRWGYVGWGVLLGVLNLLFSYGIGSFALRHMAMTSNGIVQILRDGGEPGGLGMVYLTTGIQLFGEELVTVLSFLFVLWVGVAKLGWSRTVSIVIAWIGSALIFGAMHLSTYGWNVVQALFLIGPIRLVLTLAYIKTKSIWASTIAHVLNDWSMFTLTVWLSGARAAG